MGRKFENNKTKRKISHRRISPFSCPKSVEDQKKGLHHQKLGKNQKKRSSPRFCPLVCSNFQPKLQRGGPCCNFAYYSMLIILFWRPKGHGTMLPPPKYAPVYHCSLLTIFLLTIQYFFKSFLPETAIIVN